MASLRNAIMTKDRARRRDDGKPRSQIIDTIYSFAGATAVYEGHLLHRHFQDIHVITQHLQGRLSHYELVGRHWLGLKIDEARL